MKRILSLLIAFIMCLSAVATLVSCNTEDNKEDNTTEKIEAPTKDSDKDEDRTKAPKDDETTEKSTDDSEDEENTTEEATTEEVTTEPEKMLTEYEWTQLKYKDQYRNVTILTVDTTQSKKHVDEMRVVDGMTYSFSESYNLPDGIPEVDYFVTEINHVQDSLIFPVIPDYDEVVYDEATGVYSCINPEEIITVKNQQFKYTKYDITTKGGKLYTIYTEVSAAGTDYVTSTCEIKYYDYGTTVPFKAPNYGENIDNRENITVNANEWEGAFNLNYDYWQLKFGGYNGFEIGAYVELYVAKNIIKEVEIVYGLPCKTTVLYIEKTNDGWYEYNDLDQYFDADIERSYEKIFKTVETNNGVDKFENRKNMFILIFNQFKNQFNNFTFDEENGYYFAESLYSSAYNNVKAYFEDGRLVRLTMIMAGGTEYDFTLSYDQLEITLPDATLVE